MFFNIVWRAITPKSELLLPSLIPNVKEKFRVIVLRYKAKSDNLELGIFTSKHDSTYHRKISIYRFCVHGKNSQGIRSYLFG